jgi:hypothetical protein
VRGRFSEIMSLCKCRKGRSVSCSSVISGGGGGNGSAKGKISRVMFIWRGLDGLTSLQTAINTNVALLLAQKQVTSKMIMAAVEINSDNEDNGGC